MESHALIARFAQIADPVRIVVFLDFARHRVVQRFLGPTAHVPHPGLPSAGPVHPGKALAPHDGRAALA
jgi:hypothetical protein